MTNSQAAETTATITLDGLAVEPDLRCLDCRLRFKSKHGTSRVFKGDCPRCGSDLTEEIYYA